MSKLKKRPRRVVLIHQRLRIQRFAELHYRGGVQGLLATDAAIRAVAPYVHNHLIEEAMGDLTGQKLTDTTGSLVPVKDEEGASSN